MASRITNPMEAEVLEWANLLTDLTFELADEIAPYSEWWSKNLTKDQQVWRYLDVRDEIMEWLGMAAVYMGWIREDGSPDTDRLLKNLEEIFMGRAILALMPPEAKALLPKNLKMMVKASPIDAAAHIRNMENEIKRREMAQRIVAKTMKAPPKLGFPDVPEDMLGSLEEPA